MQGYRALLNHLLPEIPNSHPSQIVAIELIDLIDLKVGLRVGPVVQAICTGRVISETGV
jgi:hypothetical protein